MKDYLIEKILEKCNDEEVIKIAEANVIYHDKMHQGHVRRLLRAIEELGMKIINRRR